MSKLTRFLGYERVLVSEAERVVALYEGKVLGIYGAGVHRMPNFRGTLVIERHNLAEPRFRSTYEKALIDRLPDVAARHLTVVKAGEREVVLIERESDLLVALAPNARLVLWTDAGPWTIRRFDLAASLKIEPLLARRLALSGRIAAVQTATVPDGKIGLLMVDGVYRETLGPGFHAFWASDAAIEVRQVDLKPQVLDVNGQELLTRDRVTIRVNVTAGYRIVDPIKATIGVKDAGDMLYRALQLAFRETLGGQTLDHILETKAGLKPEAVAALGAEMAAVGVELGAVSLKDVILPGEMRDILNQVVTAEKQAEANVIRRREETNATRSLLNTAKVMAENPVMLRLKELEALETIASKVDRLTIHNGVSGLMNDIVQLRDT
ncbi:slipin family protein [Methylobrevis albus]|uniref:Slipin family protein n=1 Tax=Methylobrevis albus TaxID=2793297 RepID=A0A931MXK9_9HYPH|nr:slipin family protein [Methylobrevis albus]MBH0237040.1 slipin family protein [Methylobrevis albus]